MCTNLNNNYLKMTSCNMLLNLSKCYLYPNRQQKKDILEMILAIRGLPLKHWKYWLH